MDGAADRSSSRTGENSPDTTSSKGSGTGEATDSPLSQARRRFSGSRGLSHFIRYGEGARYRSDRGVPVRGVPFELCCERGLSTARGVLKGACRLSGERDLLASLRGEREPERCRSWDGELRPIVLMTCAESRDSRLEVRK